MINRIPDHVRAAALPAAFEAATILSPTLSKWPRTKKVVQLIAAVQTGYKAIQSLRSHFEKPSEDWTVTVKSGDTLYDIALDLLAANSERNWKAIEAEYVYQYDAMEDEESADVSAKPVERVERTLTLDGHKIFTYVDHVPISQGPATITLSMGSKPARQTLTSPQVVFVASDEAGQKAVLAALKAAAIKQKATETKRTAKLMVSTSYGNWQRKGDLPARPVESIAVTDNQVQAIVDDILAFRELEAEYVRRGIPFHRGYLLYGPPGTGKTSAVKAIAHAVGSDLYAASIGGLGADTSLQEMVSNVRSGILLLEDIDSFGAARQRDEEKQPGAKTGNQAGISTTGLLNALDGVETPHGLITIMTTNHREFLDGALIRPGRVDKHVYFGYPDDATVERHFEFFFSRPASVPLYAAGRSGAELNEVLVAHMTDPAAAELVLSSPVRAVAA